LLPVPALQQEEEGRRAKLHKQLIPVSEPDLSGNELKYVTDCIESGWISSLGGYVAGFEEAFSRLCGVRHGIAACNGTAALHLALVTLGIGPGDEVIVPTMTFVATANAVTYAGAKPIFVDSDPEVWTIDPRRIEEKISPRTKAVIPVHLYGHPVAMEPILGIAKRNGLLVIEDAAEAHGAQCGGQMVGSLGDIGCFSFYGNKIITTGEGGMLVTDSPQWAERAAFLLDQAMSKERRYWHPEIGYNYRMSNVQAAIGLAQTERLDEFVEKKRQIARWYTERLADVPGLSLPLERPWARSVFWMYSVLIGNEFGLDRDQLMTRLREQGIDSRPFFWPIHLLPSYNRGESLPVAERLAQQGINLPSGVRLTERDVDQVVDAIRTSRRRYSRTAESARQCHS
jgi:perosamine synthetase